MSSVAPSMYLAVANSSPSSSLPQWTTETVVASTLPPGSADACAGEQGAGAATGAADAGFGDAGSGGAACAAAEGPGDEATGAGVEADGGVEADTGLGHAFGKGARALRRGFVACSCSRWARRVSRVASSGEIDKAIKKISGPREQLLDQAEILAKRSAALTPPPHAPCRPQQGGHAYRASRS